MYNIEKYIRWINNINTIVRKLAHIFLFFVLAVFILILAKLKYKVLRPKHNVIAILICFIYGSLDEIYQLFVFGRSSKFSDVLIDTFGACLGVIVVNIIYKKLYPLVLLNKGKSIF